MRASDNIATTLPHGTQTDAHQLATPRATRPSHQTYLVLLMQMMSTKYSKFPQFLLWGITYQGELTKGPKRLAAGVWQHSWLCLVRGNRECARPGWITFAGKKHIVVLRISFGSITPVAWLLAIGFLLNGARLGNNPTAVSS